MPVVRVRKVGVRMRQPGVTVPVTVAHAGRDPFIVLMCMVLVAHPVLVRMVVLHRIVAVFVFMAFGQVQDHADGHQATPP